MAAVGKEKSRYSDFKSIPMTSTNMDDLSERLKSLNLSKCSDKTCKQIKNLLEHLPKLKITKDGDDEERTDAVQHYLNTKTATDRKSVEDEYFYSSENGDEVVVAHNDRIFGFKTRGPPGIPVKPQSETIPDDLVAYQIQNAIMSLSQTNGKRRMDDIEENSYVKGFRPHDIEIEEIMYGSSPCPEAENLDNVQPTIAPLMTQQGIPDDEEYWVNLLQETLNNSEEQEQEIPNLVTQITSSENLVKKPKASKSKKPGPPTVKQLLEKRKQQSTGNDINLNNQTAQIDTYDGKQPSNLECSPPESGYGSSPSSPTKNEMSEQIGNQLPSEKTPFTSVVPSNFAFQQHKNIGLDQMSIDLFKYNTNTSTPGTMSQITNHQGLTYSEGTHENNYQHYSTGSNSHECQNTYVYVRNPLEQNKVAQEIHKPNEVSRKIPLQNKYRSPSILNSVSQIPLPVSEQPNDLSQTIFFQAHREPILPEPNIPTKQRLHRKLKQKMAMKSSDHLRATEQTQSDMFTQKIIEQQHLQQIQKYQQQHDYQKLKQQQELNQQLQQQQQQQDYQKLKQQQELNQQLQQLQFEQQLEQQQHQLKQQYQQRLHQQKIQPQVALDPPVSASLSNIKIREDNNLNSNAITKNINITSAIQLPSSFPLNAENPSLQHSLNKQPLQQQIQVSGPQVIQAFLPTQPSSLSFVQQPLPQQQVVYVQQHSPQSNLSGSAPTSPLQPGPTSPVILQQVPCQQPIIYTIQPQSMVIQPPVQVNNLPRSPTIQSAPKKKIGRPPKPKNLQKPVYYPPRNILPKPNSIEEAPITIKQQIPVKRVETETAPCSQQSFQNIACVIKRNTAQEVREKYGYLLENAANKTRAARDLAGKCKEQFLYIDEDGDSMISRYILEKNPLSNYMLHAHLNRLKRAEKEGQVDLCEHLNNANKYQQTAVYLATYTNRSAVLEWLLTLGADPNHLAIFSTQVEEKRRTALHYAASKGDDYHECLALLAENQNINLDEKNSDGMTPLHLAIQSHLKGKLTCYQTVQTLLLNGSDLNVGDGKSGKTGLHYLIETKDIQLIRFIFGMIPHTKLKDYLRSKNYRGDTALHYAAQLAMSNIDEHKQIIEVLLSSGADPGIKNFENQSAFNVLYTPHKNELAYLLKTSQSRR